MKRYDSEDIWNADQTGLLYKDLPRTVVTNRDDVTHTTKTSKLPITLMLAVSLIGKNARFLYFERINLSTFTERTKRLHTSSSTRHINGWIPHCLKNASISGMKS